MTRDGLSNSRIVLTGGAGFIGSHVAEALLREGCKQLVLVDDLSNGLRRNLGTVLSDPRASLEETDLSDAEKLRRIIDGADYVLHFAAVKHSAAQEQREALFATNVRGTYEIVEACKAARVRKVVFASSVYVYGVDNRNPFRESDELLNRTFYGASKIFGEQVLREAHASAGLDSVSLRFFFVYGPRLYQKRYTYAFVSKTLRHIREGTAPVVYGDGRQIFDYIYIDDAVRATLSALKSDVSNRAINVGTGRGMTIMDLCRMLIRKCGGDIDPVLGQPDETFGTVRVADTSRAENELGFRAEVSMEEGIDRVIRWWRQEEDPPS